MSLNGRTLVLRADATATIGAGHAMRLAVLAETWLTRGGAVALCGRIEVPFVVERYAALGIAAVDREAVEGDVLVVDTYESGARFRATQVAGVAIRVLVDDFGVDVAPGFDVVWNPNGTAESTMYRQFGGAVFAGTEYLAVRDGLPAWRGGGEEIVVTMGGGRPPSVVLEAFHRLAELFPEQPFAATGQWAPSRWRRIEADRLWHDVATARQLISAAGTTVWEAAAVGVPVGLLMIADNQRLVYRWARDAGAPGINTTLLDAEFLAHQLRSLIGVACPLPKVTNGTSRLVDGLLPLAAAGRRPTVRGTR